MPKGSGSSDKRSRNEDGPINTLHAISHWEEYTLMRS